MSLRVLRIERDIPVLPLPNLAELVLCDQLPPTERITTAFAFAFLGEDMVFADLVERGVDIPGGHIEAGESPEEAVAREVWEETGARITRPLLIGYRRHRLLGPRPPGFPYPYPDSYMVFYGARIAALEDFAPTAETRGRVLLPPPAARGVRSVAEHIAFYEAARAAAGDGEGA